MSSHIEMESMVKAFLVLDANPLDNIANTRRIARVYLRGREIDRAALRTELKGNLAAATRPPAPAVQTGARNCWPQSKSS